MSEATEKTLPIRNESDEQAMMAIITAFFSGGVLMGSMLVLAAASATQELAIFVGFVTAVVSTTTSGVGFYRLDQVVDTDE